ncbi:MAG: hypothetical protein EOP35_00060 [Rubrivivax sp.]|nr:MAG: hypothetical protein EOP35_00060 [Rubrivivax sp.]
MHSLIQRLSRLATAAAVCTAATAPALAARLETYAGGVGGLAKGSVDSGCYTSGTPAELAPFFRGGSFPAGGIAACGLTGGLDQDSGASGTVTSTFSIAPVKLGIPASSAGWYSGEADARASYGALGVAAQGRFAGGVANGGPGTYDNTVAAAKFTDTLTATGAAMAPGSAGFVRYAFELHGSASAFGAPAAYYTGGTFVELLYAQTGSSTYGWNLALQRGSSGLIQNTTPPAGWTTGTGFLSGRSTFYSFDLPITWGQAWDLTVGLVTTANGEVISDFLGTARVTGLQLFDSRHQEVTDFQLRSASGTDYLAPVPEAGSAALMLAGLAGLGGLTRLRRRRLHAG